MNPEFGEITKFVARERRFRWVLAKLPKAAAVLIREPHDLGKFICDRRKSLGLRQGGLASSAGIDQGNLSKIEKGAVGATLETYLRLCKALGIDLTAEPLP